MTPDQADKIINKLYDRFADRGCIAASYACDRCGAYHIGERCPKEVREEEEAQAARDYEAEARFDKYRRHNL